MITVPATKAPVAKQRTAKKRYWQEDVVESLIHWLDRIADWLGRKPALAKHLATGIRGEEAAFFHLQRQGYTIIARNWRTSGLRGDIDLVGWHDGFLCFIEVKTRTRRGNIAAEFAVNHAKKAMLRRMARAFLRKHRNGRDRIPVRFDILSIYMIENDPPQFELYQRAFSWY